MTDIKGRVLIVAGSDSGGGAGMQADIKTVTALGGYAMSAITALTAQNTQGVAGISDVPADFVAEQMRVVLDDIGADVIKIGMVHRADVIEAVCEVLDNHAKDIPVVADSVMIAKGGAALLEGEAMHALRHSLVPRASLLTPNIPEAEELTGMAIKSIDDATHAAMMLATLGPQAILLKGGHLPGHLVRDILLHGEKTMEVFEHERIDTRHTHGTGCTLASAVATGIAQGMELHAAVVRARAYVFEAISSAPGFGGGHGPLNHGHTVAPFGA